MSNTGQKIYLIRHGETEWSLSGQHTGRTDIALTEEGRRKAERIKHYLQGRKLHVRSSPLARALDTCRLAGYGDEAVIDPNLLEWDYGIYEGRTTADIRKENPQWSVWLSPITNGESLQQVAERARTVIAQIDQTEGDVALFAHGHILRILAACWMGQAPLLGRYLGLETASVSMLGYERQTRVIWQWNVVPE